MASLTQHSLSSPPSPSSHRVCRICHLSQSEDPSRPLYHPCRCKGSMALTHQDCLVTWLSMKSSQQCEICHHTIQFQSHYDSDAARSPSIIDVLMVVVMTVVTIVRMIVGVIASINYWTVLKTLGLVAIVRPLMPSALPLSALSLSPPELLSLIDNPLSLSSMSLALSVIAKLAQSCLLVYALAFLSVLMALSVIHGYLLLAHEAIDLFFVRVQYKCRLVFRTGYRRWCDAVTEFVHTFIEIDSVSAMIVLTLDCHFLVFAGAIMLPYYFTTAVATIIDSSVSDGSAVRALMPWNLSYVAMKAMVAAFNGGLIALVPQSIVDASLSRSQSLSPSVLLHLTSQQFDTLYQHSQANFLLSLSLFYAFCLSLVHLLPLTLWRCHPVVYTVRELIVTLVNVTVLMSVEYVVLPTVMGFIAHVSLLPVLSSTIESLIVASAVSPYITLASHWLLGLLLFLLLTTIIRASMKLFRHRVVRLMFTEHPKNPITEIVMLGFSTILYKLLRSFVIYSVLAIILIHLPSLLLSALSRVVRHCDASIDVPAITSATSYLLVPLQLTFPHQLNLAFTLLFVSFALLVNSCSLATVKARVGKFHSLLVRVTRFYGLDDWCVKDDDEREKDRRDLLERRRLRNEILREQGVWDAHDDADNDQDNDRGDGGDGAGVFDEDGDDDLFEIDDFQMAVIDDEDHLHHHHHHHPHGPVNDDANDNARPDDHDLDPEDEEDLLNNPGNNPNIRAVLSSIESRRSQELADAEVEKTQRSEMRYFFLRFLACAATLVAIASVGVAVNVLIPLLIGRVVLSLIPLVTFHSNDLLAIVVGSMVLSYTPSIKMSLSKQSLFTAFNALLSLSYLFVVFPLCVALLGQHALLIPLRTTVYQQPVFYLEHSYLLGLVTALMGSIVRSAHSLVHEFIAVEDHERDGGNGNDHGHGRAPALQPVVDIPRNVNANGGHNPDDLSAIFHSLDSLVEAIENGCRVRLLTLLYDLIIPSAEFFLVHLSLPYLFARALLPLRTLLPWWMRFDELTIVALLRPNASRSDDAVISRSIEEFFYHYSFLTLLLVRAGWYGIDWMRQSYSDYMARAYEMRWSTTTLVNVDEGSDEDEKADDDSEVQQSEGGESDAASDDDSESESDSEVATNDDAADESSVSDADSSEEEKSDPSQQILSLVTDGASAGADGDRSAPTSTAAGDGLTDLSILDSERGIVIASAEVADEDWTDMKL